MTAIRDARRQVADALEAVLPGRVNAYATTRMQRNVAPYVWIESPRADPESVGRSSQLWVAVFPVRIVVDGATHAAMAMLDDLIGGVIDAVDGIIGMQARHVEPGDVYVDSNHVLRGATVDVAVTITARTFCPARSPQRRRRAARTRSPSKEQLTCPRQPSSRSERRRRLRHRRHRRRRLPRHVAGAGR